MQFIPPSAHALNEFITIVALVVGAAQLIFIWNLVWSRFRGRQAEPNPWRAASLEWMTPQTPPAHGNWGAELPTVHRWAYAYSVPGAASDMVPQNAPPEAGGVEPGRVGARCSEAGSASMSRLHALPIRSLPRRPADPGPGAAAPRLAAAWREPGHRAVALHRRRERAVLALHRRLRDAHERARRDGDPHAVAAVAEQRLAGRRQPAAAARQPAGRTTRPALRWPLLAGGACALAFIVVQWWAWQEMLGRQVSLQGNPAGSFFYLLTAMHALHVFGGLGGWGVALHASRQRPFDPVDAGWRVALCARYWHFLLVVWLVLFAAFSFITPERGGTASAAPGSHA